MSSGLFKNVIFKMCLEIIYSAYVQIGFGIKWPIMVDVLSDQTKLIWAEL